MNDYVLIMTYESPSHRISQTLYIRYDMKSLKMIGVVKMRFIALSI